MKYGLVEVLIKWVVRSSEFITLTLLFSLISLLSSYAYLTEDFYQREDLELFGLKVHIYFSPEPGKIELDVDKVEGVINVSRINTDYTLTIDIQDYGIVHDNISINSDILKRRFVLNSSINSFFQKISLNIPETGNFTAFFIIDLIWSDFNSILENKTVKLAATYQVIGTGFDLANIVFPGGIIIFFVCVIIIISLIKQKYSSKSINKKNIDIELEKINQLTKKYLKKSGDFIGLDLSEIDIYRNPGSIALLKKRKSLIRKKFLKLEPRLKELQNIDTKIEEAQEPIFNNELFKFISSYFIRASRKREFLPLDEYTKIQVQKIRDSLLEGKWDIFRDREKIKLGWAICSNYAKEIGLEKESFFKKDFNINKEIKILSIMIDDYIKNKKSILWPPDKEIVIRAKEDIFLELKKINEILVKFQTQNESNRKKYSRNNIKLKKTIEGDILFLKSMNEFIEEDITNRLNFRLQKIHDLIVKDMDLIKDISELYSNGI